MSLPSALALLGLAITAGATSGPTAGSQKSCSSFGPTPLAGVAFASSTHFAANTHVNISNVYSSIDETNLPAFCRVELVITTNATAGTTALAEVWLPDDWNGRVLTVGNGGLAGGGTPLPITRPPT
ncbi:hypothetical protein TRAPUB_6029 [Trametes pubescens]|uniref:feruloyl esterase n=1 Tax=Trametes pubescens TaxID=154538 RepID=A0A1M2V6V0_TRAPU|nr:hypothetical protein TRAPUB_6029 [Trametes pubescens]